MGGGASTARRAAARVSDAATVSARVDELEQALGAAEERAVLLRAQQDAQSKRIQELQETLASAELRVSAEVQRADAERARANALAGELDEQMQLEEALLARIRALEQATAGGAGAVELDGAASSSCKELEAAPASSSPWEPGVGEEPADACRGEARQWQYLHLQRWCNYDDDCNAKLNAAEAAGQKRLMLEIEIRQGGKKVRNHYEVDLDAKTQTQSKTRNMRDIRCVTQLVEMSAPRAADFFRSIPALVLQRDVPALVEGMHTHVEAPEVQEAGCKALMSMATTSDSVRVKIEQAGGLEAIFAAMRMHGAASGVQEQACRALRRMFHLGAAARSAAEREKQKALLRHYGIKLILLALQGHPQNSSICYEACAVVRILANSEILRTLLLSCRTCERHPARNPEEISEGGEEGDRVKRGAGGSMDKNGGGSEAPQAVTLILGFSDASATLRHPSEEAVSLTHSYALKQHCDHAGVGAQACGALRFLAAKDAHVRVAIAASGGRELIHHAIAASVATPECKKWGKQLLEFLSFAAAEAAAERRRYADALAAARSQAEQGFCRPLCLMLRAEYQAELQANADAAAAKQEETEDALPPPAAAGASGQGAQPEEDPAPDKYTARKLLLEASTLAAAGLLPAIGLVDEQLLGNLMQDPEAALELEILLNGTREDKANFYYIQTGTAQKWEDIPAHVKRDLVAGFYHGGAIAMGDYDAGHAGMTLDDFVDHAFSRMAGLRRHHVLALRLYTSSTYRQLNGPLRKINSATGRGQAPHPFRFTIYVLSAALKMLRVVAAKLNPEEFNTVKWLYRGMADVTLDTSGRFLLEGGTEVALMSTTDKLEVALSYARSRCPLVFKYKTQGLNRGCSIQFLSLYPFETEFLYPPLTFISAEGECYVEDGITFLDVTPQMS